MKIIADKSNLEHTMEKFLVAAQSDTLRPACDFFFIHANDLSAGGPRQTLLLVDADFDDDMSQAIDVVSARTVTQGRRFLKDFLPIIMEPVKTAMVKFKQNLPKEDEQSKDSQALIVNELIRSDYGTKLETFLPRVFANNVGLAADFLGNGLLKLALELRQRQMAATNGIIQYDEMVDALQKLGLFTPQVRILLCGECSNLELTFGQHTGYMNKCTKCSNDAHVVSLLFPDPWLELVKFSDNSDLPLFISAYLKSKSFLPVTIAPCAEYDLPGQGEVDVALPDLEVAYEVKIFNSPATLNPNKISSEAQQLATQLQRYQDIGFKRVKVVTNIPQKDAEKLVVAAKEKHPLTLDLEAIGVPFDNMLKKYDAMSSEIEKACETSLKKEIDGRAGKV